MYTISEYTVAMCIYFQNMLLHCVPYLKPSGSALCNLPESQSIALCNLHESQSVALCNLFEITSVALCITMKSQHSEIQKDTQFTTL